MRRRERAIIISIIISNWDAMVVRATALLLAVILLGAGLVACDFLLENRTDRSEGGAGSGNRCGNSRSNGSRLPSLPESVKADE